MVHNSQFLGPKIATVNILLSSFQILSAQWFTRECSICRSRDYAAHDAFSPAFLLNLP